MKRLTVLPLPPAYLDRYIEIRDKKHNPTRADLINAHALISQRYQTYEQAIAGGTLHSLAIDDDALAVSATLRACYGGATQPLNKLKEAIKSAQPSRLLKYCPMCGTTLPGTFDHYLPAVRFPELAVHPLNLVPCCAKCNSTKDDDWLSPAGRRQFLYAYFDQLPDSQFVHVTLRQHPALPGVGAAFSLLRPAGVHDDVWQLISSHFTRLKLIKRYDDGGNDEIAEILAGCRSHLNAGGADARAFLTNQAADRAATYGRNHWVAVLMAAMASHVNLSAWVNAA